AGKIYAMTDLPPHTFAVGRLHEALRAVLPQDGWTIREEKPILIGRYWAPKTDIEVLSGSDAIYTAKLLWLIWSLGRLRGAPIARTQWPRLLDRGGRRRGGAEGATHSS